MTGSWFWIEICTYLDVFMAEPKYGRGIIVPLLRMCSEYIPFLIREAGYFRLLRCFVGCIWFFLITRLLLPNWWSDWYFLTLNRTISFSKLPDFNSISCNYLFKSFTSIFCTSANFLTVYNFSATSFIIICF